MLDERLKLMPQQGPMMLLDSILSFNKQFIQCAVTVKPFFHGESKLSSAIALEYMAQAIAAHGIVLYENINQKMGMIASIKNLKIGADSFAVGMELLSEGVLVLSDDQLSIYNCTLREISGDIVGSAVITIYHPENISNEK